MTVASLIGALLLAANLGALTAAASRLVSPIAPRGIDRVLAVTTSVAATTAVEALLLGVAELGTNPVALTALTLVLWAAARGLLPEPDLTIREEIRTGVGGFGDRDWVIAGTVAGVVFAAAAYVLLEPTSDPDSVLFHLTEAQAWIDNGSPGSIVPLSDSYPIGSYPSTNETILAWIGGVAGTVGPILLWPVAMALLLGTSLVAALRAIGVGVLDRGLATAALLAVPLVAAATGSLDTDLASTAWLGATLALCASVASGRARPELLAFAVVAAGLAIGTKTSTALIAVLALAAAWALADPKPRLRPLAIAAGIALAAGGVWYLRNLFDHGSPLWPFYATPFGDPVPAGIDAFSTRFISAPIETLDGRLGEYLDELGASVLILLSSIVLPLIARDRRLIAAGAVVVVLSVLSWTIAPATGETPGSAEAFFTVTGIRYLLPTVLLATIVVAAATTRAGPVGSIARGVLVVAIAWGAADLIGAPPGAPSLAVLAIGAAAGAAAALAIGRAAAARPLALIGIGGLAALVIVALYPSVYLDRYADRADEGRTIDPPVLYGQLVEWFQDQDRYADGHGPIALAEGAFGPLASPEFDHRVSLIAGDSDCSDISQLAAGGWAVVPTSAGAQPEGSAASCFENEDPDLVIPTLAGNGVAVYSVGRFP